MKSAATFVLMSILSAAAHAELDHTVGGAYVDTFYQSQDMQLEISGKPAEQLYGQLKLAVESDTKVGAGIVCRINQETIKPVYVCDLNVHADGTVTK